MSRAAAAVLTLAVVLLVLGSVALFAWSFAASSVAWEIVGAVLVLLVGVAACDQTRRA